MSVEDKCAEDRRQESRQRAESNTKDSPAAEENFRFLPTAPSFVVVVELQQLIVMTSRRGDQSEGTDPQRLVQSQGALRAVTNTRDCWYSSRKGHDWAKRWR
ncbi:hypothetical protein NQZ68_020143 [Dissostichus eleginoides]|nr:hypothetical protein NQZ68_020143 [Dissostichus eleginoides]